jgi:hypothetical protein
LAHQSLSELWSERAPQKPILRKRNIEASQVTP